MKINTIITSKINALRSICKRYKVSSLYVFGSAVNGEFDDESSDIDMLVEIEEEDPIERGELLMSFEKKLEQLFKRKVDLLTKASLHNPVLIDNINKTKVPVYDGKREKVL